MSESYLQYQVRAPNRSDNQVAYLKNLIQTLDGGDIWTTILKLDLSRDRKDRKKRAWHRVLTEFQKIPENKVYGMEQIQLKFKSFKKELIEEEGEFQAASLTPNAEQPSAAAPGATNLTPSPAALVFEDFISVKKVFKELGEMYQ